MKLNFLGLLALVIIVGAAVGGSYGAGFVAGKGSAPAAVAAPATAQTQSQAQAQSQAASGATDMTEAMRASGGTAAGRGVLGTVEKIEGNILTITAATGGSTQVTIGQDTPLQKTAAASRDELKPGVRVMVVGQPGTGGSLVASSIQVLPADAGTPGPQPRSKPQGTPVSNP